jgi:LacI family transcriptional regulator/LacI family repressor for deo operon, udp, cdd, tsx, nupC, and nupG
MKMIRSRVNIKDIARIAGVSHSTVSRALSNSPLISVETRERIQELSVALGYTPDAVAQSLQNRQTKTIGLVVSSIADPFFADLVEGVDDVASEAGLSLFINFSHNDPEREVQVIETFHRRRVDGIIAASSRLSQRHRKQLINIRVPVVTINRQPEEEGDLFHFVSIDDHYGAEVAVNHLLQLGHRRIGYLGMGNRFLSNQNRYKGYLDALAEARVQPGVDWVQIVSPEDADRQGDSEAARCKFSTLLSASVSAVFCYNDRTALGVLMRCRELGIQVPDQLSLVGFDDIEMAHLISPQLTTIQQPRRGLGRQAMHMLLELLDEKSVSNKLILPGLIIRESTRPLVE